MVASVFFCPPGYIPESIYIYAYLPRYLSNREWVRGIPRVGLEFEILDAAVVVLLPRRRRLARGGEVRLVRSPAIPWLIGLPPRTRPRTFAAFGLPCPMRSRPHLVGSEAREKGAKGKGGGHQAPIFFSIYL